MKLKQLLFEAMFQKQEVIDLVKSVFPKETKDAKIETSGAMFLQFTLPDPQSKDISKLNIPFTKHQFYYSFFIGYNRKKPVLKLDLNKIDIKNLNNDDTKEEVGEYEFNSLEELKKILIRIRKEYFLQKRHF